MEFYVTTILPICMLVLVILTSWWMAKKVWGALVKYGEGWATLGGVIAFSVSFLTSSFVMLSLYITKFGR